MLGVFWQLHQWAFPSSFCFSSSGHPCSLKHNYNEVRPVNNPTVISECSSESKRCMSLALNKKLEMINLSEEGMLKAKISWKLALLCQTVSQAMNRKKKFLKEIKSTASVSTWMIRKHNGLTVHMGKALVVWLEGQMSHNISLNQSLIQSNVLTLFTSRRLKEVRKLQKKLWSWHTLIQEA